MKLRKKNKTLYFKLCMYFSILVVSICILITGVIYFWFSYKFNNLFEDNIINVNNSNDQIEEIDGEWIVGVNSNSMTLVEAIHGEEVVRHIQEQALKQEEDTKTYEEKIEDKQLIYRINVSKEDGERIYTYSIIRNIYKEKLPTVIISIVIFAVIIIVIAIYIVKFICKRLVKDIEDISDYTEKIASKDWDEPININTESEELVSLINSIECMKDKLRENENTRQSMLQYISHELKTPIMIIRSYTEAIKEDIYPLGDLNSSLDTVIKQTNRMEDKVGDLLFITKLDNEIDNLHEICINDTLNKVISTFSMINKSKDKIEIKVLADENLYITGDEEKIQVLFENMIDNQIRYANNEIIIRLSSYDNYVNILFFNDGESISIEDNIFRPFIKGKKGQYGLGLSICKRIVELHKGKINHINTNYGCLFKVSLKQDKKT